MRLTIIALILLIMIPSAIGAEFLASKASRKYHLPSCKLVKLISKPNLVIFNSPGSALTAGYTPCSVCNAPTR